MRNPLCERQRLWAGPSDAPRWARVTPETPKNMATTTANGLHARSSVRLSRAFYVRLKTDTTSD